MTKRHATFIQLLYKNILDDILDEMPALQKELRRDYLRLCSALENHGLRFFTMDMVEYGKHFDKCLDAQRLTRFVGPHMRPYKNGGIVPRLFRGLFLRVFQSSGCLQPTCCVNSIRFLRQLFYVAKKIKLECTDERTTKTVRSFFQVDGRVANPSIDWLSDNPCFNAARNLSLFDGYERRCQGFVPEQPTEGGDAIPIHRGLLVTLQQVSDLGSASLGIFDPEEWRCKHGPGAVSEKTVSKFDFPSWPEKLDRIFPMDTFAFANMSLWSDSILSGSATGRFSSWESPSRLIAVPKTQKAPRLIASEPVAHQWCQQLVFRYLDAKIESSFYSKIVHIHDQSHNQRMARRASIDGSFMTIDLSEASDRVSCWLVERMWRRNPSLLSAFHACRTRYISNEIDKDSPRLYRLRKFSTMGSALTFPVQSLVFANIALAALLFAERRVPTYAALKEFSRQVLVFGDDIIVPTHVGYLVSGLLRYLGFEINRSKTFWKGRFRESCGGDYFDGHDVTPTYSLTVPSRQRPESLVSCVATRNNFFRSGYSRSAQYLKSAILKEKFLLLPELPQDYGILCWETFGDVSLEGLRCRKSSDTHQTQIYAHCQSGKVHIAPDRGDSHLLQYFTEAPPPSVSWRGGVRGRPKSYLRPRWVTLWPSSVKTAV